MENNLTQSGPLDILGFSYTNLTTEFWTHFETKIDEQSDWNSVKQTILKTLTLSAPTPQNGQTHSKNESANHGRIVWVCLTMLWSWRLKG